MDDSGNNQRKKKTTRNEGEKNNKGTKSAAAAQLLDPTLDLHSPEVKFGRMIGGTDQRARHRAVKSLKAYLRARADLGSGCGISELDLMKLWKVRLYCSLHRYYSDRLGCSILLIVIVEFLNVSFVESNFLCIDIFFFGDSNLYCKITFSNR